MISICAFLCLSVYVHMVAFMALSFFVERTMDFFFPHIKNPLLTSRSLHTWGSVFLAVLLTSAGVMVTRTQPTVCCVEVSLYKTVLSSSKRLTYTSSHYRQI